MTTPTGKQKSASRAKRGREAPAQHAPGKLLCELYFPDTGNRAGNERRWLSVAALAGENERYERENRSARWRAVEPQPVSKDAEKAAGVEPPPPESNEDASVPELCAEIRAHTSLNELTEFVRARKLHGLTQANNRTRRFSADGWRQIMEAIRDTRRLIESAVERPASGKTRTA